MYITSETLAKILNINLEYLFKVMNVHGIRQMSKYHVSHLRTLYVLLDSKTYRREVIKMKLHDVINCLESVDNCEECRHVS